MTTIKSIKIEGLLNEGAYGKIYQVTLPSSEAKILKAFIAQKDYADFFQNVLREIFFSRILLRNHYLGGSINVFEDNTVTAGYLQTKADCTVKYLFPMTILDIAKKFNDIVEQLLWFHDQDIIHRDIKPQNILYDNHNLYLIDTSLSIRTTMAESNLKTVITLWYRPLEILNGKSYTSSADIWSLGITLLEAYTGKALLLNFHKETDVILFIQQYFTPEKVFIHGKSKEEICFNNLLTSMLQLNPVNRASIYEIVQHEFWTLGTNSTSSTNSTSITNSTNITSSTSITSITSITSTTFLKPCKPKEMLYIPQMNYTMKPLNRKESLPFEGRIKAFDAILRFTILHRLPLNIALLAFYFLDTLFPYNNEQNSLTISCLFTSIVLESDIFPCMDQIAKYFMINEKELDSLFPRIVNTFQILIRCPLPNTYKKARYIRDIRLIPLHMVDISVWQLSLSQIQRLFTNPNTADQVWLTKIAEVEENNSYKQLWLNQLENNQKNISFYF